MENLRKKLDNQRGKKKNAKSICEIAESHALTGHGMSQTQTDLLTVDW